MNRYIVTKEAAIKIKEWIAAGRGIAIWRRIDFSGRGDMISPARTVTGEAMTKPHWSCSNTPVIHEALTDFTVSIDKEVKRFHVGTRIGSQGMLIKVTDAGSRKIRAEVEKAGEGAYYVLVYDEYKNVVILKPESTMPLEEFNA